MEQLEKEALTTKAQPIMKHLIELRNRLIHAVGGILIVFASLYYFANDLYIFVSEPLRQLLPVGSTMIATDVASPFFAPFKLTLMTSIFVAMPYVLYQSWCFIAPALYNKEKRLAFPLLFSSIVLFYFGMAFAYFVVFPIIFGFFTSAAPEGVTVMTDISRYLDFILKLFFAFGLTFEIPIATIILVAAGITSTLSLITPPDIISQTRLAVPMWLLFEVGILFAKLIEKKEVSKSDTFMKSPHPPS